MGASAASPASQEEEETKEQGRRKEGMAEGGVKSGDPHREAGEDMFPYRNIQRFVSFHSVALLSEKLPIPLPCP